MKYVSGREFNDICVGKMEPKYYKVPSSQDVVVIENPYKKVQLIRINQTQSKGTYII